MAYSNDVIYLLEFERRQIYANRDTLFSGHRSDRSWFGTFAGARPVFLHRTCRAAVRCGHILRPRTACTSSQAVCGPLSAEDEVLLEARKEQMDANPHRIEFILSEEIRQVLSGDKGCSKRLYMLAYSAGLRAGAGPGD